MGSHSTLEAVPIACSPPHALLPRSARPGAPRVVRIAGSMGALDVFLAQPDVLGGPGGELQSALHKRESTSGAWFVCERAPMAGQVQHG